MKPTYSEVITPSGDTVIVALYDNGVMLSIPMDEANSDYQAYLNKDKSEQSTPSVTDEAKTK
jgi:hypothetical protein